LAEHGRKAWRDSGEHELAAVRFGSRREPLESEQAGVANAVSVSQIEHDERRLGGDTRFDPKLFHAAGS